MAELGPNYNIQCMKLFQELKASFPSIPDSVVRHCMKQNRNDFQKCKEELTTESENYTVGRYGVRTKGNKLLSSRRSSRRFSLGCLQTSDSNSCMQNSSFNHFNRRLKLTRTNSLSDPTSKIWMREKLNNNVHDCDTNEIIEKRDLTCDTNENKFFEENNRVLDEELISKLMTKIPEKPPEDAESMIGSSSDSLKFGDENNNQIPRNISISSGSCKKSFQRPEPLILQREQVSAGGHVDTIPTVVLTPDSPPQHSPTELRTVQTLYTPTDAKVEATVIQTEDVFFPQDALEQELCKSIVNSTDVDLEDKSLIICGNNDRISQSYIDIVPGIGCVNLPFGATKSNLNSEDSPRLDDISVSVTKSTTSVTQGKVHVVKEVGDGTISIATTTFCGISHSVTSNSSSSNGKPNARCKTVLYTINRKPIICENPFRKVFAKRKEFYQSREDRDKVSPETSSKKLIWRHSNHNCRRLSKCEQPYMAPAAPAASPIVQDSLSNLDSRNLPETNPKFFTLNANIEPFDPFIIKHDISRGLDPNRHSTSPLCSTVNLTLCPQSSRDNSPPVELLPDGSGLKYQSKVADDDGSEACLEVKVNLGGSTITTKRTGKSESTSNEISVQLVAGGGQVNILQSQTKERPPERPTSLHIPPRYSSCRGAHSMYQTRGGSPQSLPRYNSLPSFKNLAYGSNNSWEYQSHPKDEEKRIAYTRG